MTENKTGLVVSSVLGDPTQRATWGGGPKLLIEELDRCGFEVHSISSHLGRFRSFCCRLLHFVSGLGFDFRRGPLARKCASQMVARNAERLGVRDVLHVGTLDMPDASLSGLNHYIMCDSTWHLFAQWHTGFGRYPSKMVDVAESLERQSYLHAKHLFPFHRFVREDLVHHYGVDPSKITVTNVGRLQIRPYYGQKDYSRGNILFVARSHFGDKGGPLLLQAFKIAQSRNPSLTLTMVGNDEYLKLNNTVRNLVVHGSLTEDELQLQYEKAALVAVPASNLTASVYMEALACKTPVLGLNRHTVPEITANGRFGFLVDEPDPELIANRILEATADPEKLKRMGEEGQRFTLSEFTWSNVAQSIARVLLGSHTGTHVLDASQTIAGDASPVEERSGPLQR